MELRGSVLALALLLLEDPSRWTQETLAVDEEWEDCDVHSPRARRWCVEGALHRSAGVLALGGVDTEDLVQEISRLCTGSGTGLYELNDDVGYLALIRAMRKGLARLGGPVRSSLMDELLRARAARAHPRSGRSGPAAARRGVDIPKV